MLRSAACERFGKYKIIPETTVYNPESAKTFQSGSCPMKSTPAGINIATPRNDRKTPVILTTKGIFMQLTS
jgi:hypothetical protein